MALFVTRRSRRLAAAAGIPFLCAAAVLAARGFHKPWIPDAPPYRQSGPADARVVIVEFSDFQCPGCAHAMEPFKSLKSQYGERVRVVFKHMPWGFHRWSKSAALASECAGRQGRFWDLHDALFTRQAEWAENERAPEVFYSIAESLELEPKAFAECLEDPLAAAAVDADFKEARQRWVNSTPTFFVNGRRFVGGRQLVTEGKREIERLLKG